MNTENVQLIWSAGSVVAVLVGLLITLDSRRFSKHIRVAQGLMASGMSEPEAMEQSGCNHWDKAFILRIWRKYPELPNDRAEG